MAIPEVLLFDLGGVLVESAGLQELPRLLAAPMQPEDLRRKWLTSPAVGLFETGRCAEQEFAAAFIEEWELKLGRDEFLEEFRSWVRAPYAGTSCSRTCAADISWHASATRTQRTGCGYCEWTAWVPCSIVHSYRMRWV